MEGLSFPSLPPSCPAWGVSSQLLVCSSSFLVSVWEEDLSDSLLSSPRVLVSYITSPLFKKNVIFISLLVSLCFFFISLAYFTLSFSTWILLSLPRLTSTSFVLRLLSHHLLTFSSLVFASFSSCLPLPPLLLFSLFLCLPHIMITLLFLHLYHKNSFSLVPTPPCFSRCLIRPLMSFSWFICPHSVLPLSYSHTCDLPVTFSNLFNSLLSPMRFPEILFVLERLPRSSLLLLPRFRFTASFETAAQPRRTQHMNVN